MTTKLDRNGAPGNPTEDRSATAPTDRLVFDAAACGGHMPVPAAMTVPNASSPVVDDISGKIDVVVGLLKDQYKVQAAKSGERALKMSASVQQLPDSMLLDVMRPEMDGFEVCRRLPAHRHQPRRRAGRCAERADRHVHLRRAAGDVHQRDPALTRVNQTTCYSLNSYNCTLNGR